MTPYAMDATHLTVVCVFVSDHAQVSTRECLAQVPGTEL